jgi:hypothetical protein
MANDIKDYIEALKPNYEPKDRRRLNDKLFF